MGESDGEKEIEIRTLTGESTTVSISPNKSIQDLKLLLKQSFPPASSSPNFHLFLKGVKLSFQSQISSHLDGCGEFIILVPFTKRVPQQTLKPDETAKALKDSNQYSTSKLAESAWSDLMQDLSFLQEAPSSKNQSSVGSGSASSEVRNEENEENERKCDNTFNVDVQDLLLNILQSRGTNKLDENNCKRFIQVLESVNCLSDPQSGYCMLRDVNTFLNKSSFCLCPPWLKRIMKAFYFVNIYSGFLLLHQEKVTLPSLQQVLDQIVKFGFDVRNTDIEHLSVLCPQIVHFVNNEAEGSKLRNALVIFKSLVDRTDQVEANRRTPISKITNTMRKREGAFKTDMWKAVKSLMDRNGKRGVNSFSLKDLLLSVEQGDTIATKNEAKRGKRNWSEPSSSYSFEALCSETYPLLPVEMVEHLRKGIGARGQIVHVEEIKGRVANFVEVSGKLSENTRSALTSVGVTRLYSHQAESIQASLAGKNVVVATMTSSGKSLCYNIPVLEVLSQNLLACALYLFPTKALAQDQLRALLSLSKGFDVDLNIGIYDGDTPQEDRMSLRDNTRLLITNPDMLHMSVLPFHGQFKRILSNLRFVIIDEAHVYKGAFGCHSALILRRLRRLCAHGTLPDVVCRARILPNSNYHPISYTAVYGSDPSFIFCTATSANPREHAMELASLATLELIQNDGSPSAPKLFALWNPPLCLKTVAKRTKITMRTGRSADKISVTGRSSPILEVSRLFSEMVQHGLRCIAFCKTRKLCELVLCYTREILQETAPHLVNSVCSYRGGYVAQDRRRIESDFFGGNLYGVAATNALELGIDVGHVDVTLHLGFPGSIASLWQQAGRSGRREKPSLAVYVAFEGPLDQYFMKFPQKLFRGPIECCHVNAKNQQVLDQHLVCAAHEHPLSLSHDEKYFGPGIRNSIMLLKKNGFLSTDPSRDPPAEIWNYIGPEKMPSHNVSIRAIENERYKVIDKLRNEVLEEIEESKAFFQVYEGSVFMHQGKTYLVKNLDLSSKIAICQEADLKYYTKTRDYTDVHVIGGNIAYPTRISNVQYSKTTAQTNICYVTTTWFGFRRIRKGSNQVIDTVELSLPSYSYKSQAVWLRVPQSVKTAVETKMYSFRGGLHAAGHALLNVVPLYIICSTSDLASECVNPHDTRYVPERILLYDSHPGGTGISAQVQPLFTELLTAALELLMSCRCSGDAGCPNCVQNLACHEYNEVLHKDAAVMIIKGVLDSEKSNAAHEMSCSS